MVRVSSPSLARVPAQLKTVRYLSSTTCLPRAEVDSVLPAGPVAPSRATANLPHEPAMAAVSEPSRTRCTARPPPAAGPPNLTFHCLRSPEPDKMGH